MTDQSDMQRIIKAVERAADRADADAESHDHVQALMADAAASALWRLHAALEDEFGELS
jgi:hypothetical protein